jgi:hypothetical protein
LKRAGGWVVVVVVAVGLQVNGGACTCQRAENIEAKERLTKPQPKEDISAKAAEKIDVDDLLNPVTMARVCHMDGAEIAVRLGSFVWASDGALSFGRGDEGVRSAEKTRLVQASSGDFAIDTVTGDGSEMKLAYVNEIFFLKNGNGHWRVSRDPAGERNTYRTDALAVWRSFYDLMKHALVVERTGASTHAGRPVVAYALKIPDQSADARSEGQAVVDGPPAPIEVPDAGLQPAPEDDDVRRKRIAERVSKWGKRAKPAGGAGRMLVDEATGVPVLVEFEGAMLVGDGKEPARLTVKLHQKITDIGKPQDVKAPADAINEISRKKMPVMPRAILEEANVVPPLPRDAGPGGGGSGSKGKQPPAVPVPDDDEG